MSPRAIRCLRPTISRLCLAVLLAAVAPRPAVAQLQYTTSFTYDATTPPSQGSSQQAFDNLIAGDPGVSAFFDYSSHATTFTATASTFALVDFSAGVNPTFLPSPFSNTVVSNRFHFQVTIKDVVSSQAGTIDIGTIGTGTFGVSSGAHASLSISSMEYDVVNINSSFPHAVLSPTLASLTLGGVPYRFAIDSSYSANASGTGEQNSRFQLNMRAVPEPSTLALAGFAGLGLVARARSGRRRRGRKA